MYLTREQHQSDISLLYHLHLLFLFFLLHNELVECVTQVHRVHRFRGCRFASCIEIFVFKIFYWVVCRLAAEDHLVLNQI